MQGMVLAAFSPSNTPHGYNLTFAFPMLMFIIIAGALYLRFRSPHRVPGHVALESSRWAGASQAPASAPAPAAQGPATAEDEQAEPAQESTEDSE